DLDRGGQRGLRRFFDGIVDGQFDAEGRDPFTESGGGLQRGNFFDIHGFLLRKFYFRIYYSPNEIFSHEIFPGSAFMSESADIPNDAKKGDVRVRLPTVRLYKRLVRTRFPFRFGKASMTEMPLVYVRAEWEEERGGTFEGVSASGIP